MSAKKSVKKTKKAVVKKKVVVAPRKKQQTLSERFHDRNVQAGIVVVLLGFTLLLLLFTYFSSN